MTAPAAKGEKLFLLAAALLAAAAALLAPASAEASRYLPQALEPVTAPAASLEDLADAADHPALPPLTAADRLDLADLAAGTRLEAQQLGLHLASGELGAAWKTASGGQTWVAEDNVRPISEMGVKTRRLIFQGLWTDPVTGLSYARARWYDARNASWLSEDPLLDVDSPNLYAGFRLNPSFYTDPYGECINPADPECRAKWKAGALSAANKVAEYVPPFVRGLWEEPQDIGEGLGVAIRETVMDPSFPAQVLQAQVREAVATTVDIAMEDPEALVADASNKALDILADPNRAGRTGFQLGLAFGTGLLGREASVASRSTRLVGDVAEDLDDAATLSREASAMAQGGITAADDLVVTPWGTRNARTGRWTAGTRAGVDPVDDFIEHALENGYEVLGREIDIQTPFGTRRADLILRHIESQQTGGIEIKSTLAEFNKYIKGQFAKDRFINMYGGAAIGTNAEAAGLTQVDYMMKIMWGVD